MSYSLKEASDEQKFVIDNIEQQNMIVDSVAGSGKTTTVMHIAKKYFRDQILLLTYNSKLKAESRQKVRQLGLTNIEVHSYHAFACKYYDPKCFVDKQIQIVVNRNNPPRYKFDYKYIILDESQDITPLLYSLIHKIIKDNQTPNAQMCVLGDEHQSIFDYNGADYRFITLADKLFNINKNKWIRTKLTISFRLTDANANFINKCVLRKDKIKSIKRGPVPRYTFVHSMFDYLL